LATYQGCEASHSKISDCWSSSQQSNEQGTIQRTFSNFPHAEFRNFTWTYEYLLLRIDPWNFVLVIGRISYCFGVMRVECADPGFDALYGWSRIPEFVILISEVYWFCSQPGRVAPFRTSKWAENFGCVWREMYTSIGASAAFSFEGAWIHGPASCWGIVGHINWCGIIVLGYVLNFTRTYP